MRAGQIAVSKLVRVEKAHDVRTLRVCTHCGKLGNSDRMIDHGASWFHGRCFVAACGRKAFLALPRAKTNRLMWSDIGTDLMKALVKQVQS